MANHYLEFSVLLPPPETNAAEVANFIENYSCPDPQDELDFPIDLREDGVWLHTEEFGTPDLAADFIQAYLRHFDIDGGIFMSWATYCSKPRINEAGGGGFIITKDLMLTSSSDDVWYEAHKHGIDMLNR
jgi:hypothetical protein